MKAREITALVRYYDMAICNLQNELSAANARFTNQLVANNAQNADKLKCTEADFDKLLTKYAGLEQLHEAAITGFKSDIEILQAELDDAKEVAKAEKQAGVFLRHALDGAFSSLSCVTVDAVAHCNGENKEALRTFIGLVQDHVVLTIQDRVKLNSILANLDQDF